MRKTPLHRRLETLQFLEPSDWTILDGLLTREEQANEGELIVLENQEINRTRIIHNGWAHRYKSFQDGRRQIINLMLPGDIVGFYAVMRNRSDYGVEALTPLEMSIFPAADLIDALSQAPRLMLALSWIASQSERILDEQITRIGRRNATERMAHLFVELFLRLRKAGIEENEACVLPMTQSVLADTLGMSHVHANRSFKSLSRDGGASLAQGKILLKDIDLLAMRAKFDASYLEQTSLPKPTLKAVQENEPFD